MLQIQLWIFFLGNLLWIRCLKKFSVSKSLYWEQSKWDQQKFLFIFFIAIMFAFLLHLLIESFKPEGYCFEIIWCLMFEWIWKDLMFEWLRFWVIQATSHSKNYHNRLFNQVTCLNFCSLNIIGFFVRSQIKVDLKL